jgi:hypothetical protein
MRLVRWPPHWDRRPVQLQHKGLFVLLSSKLFPRGQFGVAVYNLLPGVQIYIAISRVTWDVNAECGDGRKLFLALNRVILDMSGGAQGQAPSQQPKFKAVNTFAGLSSQSTFQLHRGQHETSTASHPRFHLG